MYHENKVQKSPLNCLGYRLPTEQEWEYAAASDNSIVYVADTNGELDYIANLPLPNPDFERCFQSLVSYC